MALRLGIQTGALPSGLLLADQDVFVGATAASITGSVAHAHTVSAGLVFGNQITGDITHGHAVAATELLKRANYSITMDITLTMTPAAAMGFNVTASAITGSVTHAHSVAASTTFGAVHTGSVSHIHAVGAAMDFVTNYSIVGSVLHTHLVSGALSYTQGGQYEIVGSVTHTHTVAASFTGSASPVAFIPVSLGERAATVQEKGRVMNISTAGKRMVIS